LPGPEGKEISGRKENPERNGISEREEDRQFGQIE
jgi:hypothetical protein